MLHRAKAMGELIMSTMETVLHALKNSDIPISGEELAGELGISRNSVWKAINKLKAAGYQISAVTNRGYRLLSAGDAFIAEELAQLLPRETEDVSIEIRDSASSTNTVLKEAAEKNTARDMILIAHEQTAGKGRLGRDFFSPNQSGLYLSILVHPSCAAAEALYLTTAAAVAVTEAIKEVTGIEAQIKWVNDIYVKGKKVCGILTEASVDFESGGLNYAVVGIGINIKQPEGGFPEDIFGTAAALYTEQPPRGIKLRLAAAVITEFYRFYNAADRKAHMKEYRERSFLKGLHVTFHQGDKTECGTVTGIDEEAGLLVDLDNGENRVYSAGEVQLEKDFFNKNSED